MSVLLYQIFPCIDQYTVFRRKISEVTERPGVRIASNQIEFSLLRQIPEESGLFAYMKEKNIACLACARTSILSADFEADEETT